MKNTPIIIPIFNRTELFEKISKALNYEIGKLFIHQFPDEEIMVRIDTDLKDRRVIFFANLERPANKIFPLISAFKTAKELGANEIKLIAPYLPFMRQDKSFHLGEGITSKHFAELISHYFDGLITMDPHLHRFHSLSEIFSIPVQVLHASKSIAAWIKQNIENPLLIGPDSESKQWVKEIAESIKVPFLTLQKIRKGDREVNISIQEIQLHKDKAPILIDDIISTGKTMIETIKHLEALSFKKTVCLTIHGIFSENSYEELIKCNLKNIVSCNTVSHKTNQIDVSKEFIDAIIKRD